MEKRAANHGFEVSLVISALNLYRCVRGIAKWLLYGPRVATIQLPGLARQFPFPSTATIQLLGIALQFPFASTAR